MPSIAGLIDHLNALPHPVSVACAIASLPRPLELVATSSFTSAQPAGGAANPRVFILEPELVLSVVGEGPGRHLLELGQWVPPLRTLKGELELPLTGPLAQSAPFTRLLYGPQSTSCALCHRAEAPFAADAGSVSAAASRSAPQTVQPRSVLRQQHALCVGAPGGGERCDDLHALFDFGPTGQGAFEQTGELFLPEQHRGSRLWPRAGRASRHPGPWHARGATLKPAASGDRTMPGDEAS